MASSACCYRACESRRHLLSRATLSLSFLNATPLSNRYAISLPGEVQAARAMGDDEDYEDDVADDAAAVEDGADEEES